MAWNRKSSKVFIRRSSCLVFFLSVLQENHRIERNISLLHKNKVVKKKKKGKRLDWSLPGENTQDLFGDSAVHVGHFVCKAVKGSVHKRLLSACPQHGALVCGLLFLFFFFLFKTLRESKREQEAEAARQLLFSP